MKMGSKRIRCLHLWGEWVDRDRESSDGGVVAEYS